MTQVELATLLGLHSRTVMRWEQGKQPSLYYQKLLEAFSYAVSSESKIGIRAIHLMRVDRDVVGALRLLLQQSRM